MCSAWRAQPSLKDGVRNARRTGLGFAFMVKRCQWWPGCLVVDGGRGNGSVALVLGPLPDIGRRGLIGRKRDEEVARPGRRVGGGAAIRRLGQHGELEGRWRLDEALLAV